MKTKVKICGIKTLEAAQISINAGADFLGFNFVETSKRFIKPEIAREIIRSINAYSSSDPDLIGRVEKFSTRRVPYGNPSSSNNIKTVGVFQDEKCDIVNKLINFLKLNFVQLHGAESPGYTNLIKGAGIIKTFSLDADFEVKETISNMRKYKVDYYLLDREIRGEGELLNPDKVRELAAVFPIILAGGLTVENVASMVQLARPQVVDVAGGVETAGVKVKGKIIEFVRNTKL